MSASSSSTEQKVVKDGPIIAIEGVTGIGKTTLCEDMQEYFNKSVNMNAKAKIFKIFDCKNLENEKLFVSSMQKQVTAVQKWIKERPDHIAILDEFLITVFVCWYQVEKTDFPDWVKTMFESFQLCADLTIVLYPQDFEVLIKRRSKPIFEREWQVLQECGKKVNQTYDECLKIILNGKPKRIRERMKNEPFNGLKLATDEEKEFQKLFKFCENKQKESGWLKVDSKISRYDVKWVWLKAIGSVFHEYVKIWCSHPDPTWLSRGIIASELEIGPCKPNVSLIGKDCEDSKF